MTHECQAGGTRPPQWRIYVDLGHGGTMFPRDLFDDPEEARAEMERQKALPNAYREYRVVQVCLRIPPGSYGICGGREAVQATAERTGPGGPVQFGKPPAGGES